ncbi:MAG: DMT family transporter [Candidatus Aminicenantes bacterium]|nr:DMT family transporter [Candidatus Aminicenantes bacterium]
MKKIITPAFKGVLFALGASVGIALVFIFSRLARQTMDTRLFLFWWFGFASCWAVVILAGRRKTLSVYFDNIKNHKGFLIYFVLSETVAVFFFFYLIKLVNPAILAFLINLRPFFVVLFAFFYLKERLKTFEMLGGLVSISGVLFITFVSPDIGLVYFVMAAVMVLIFSFNNVLAKKKIQDVSPLLMTVLRIFGIFFLYMVVIFSSGGFRLPTFRESILLTAGSLSGPILGVFTLLAALKYIKVATASLIKNSQPFLVILFSALFLGTTVSFEQFIGGTVIVIGISILLTEKRLSLFFKTFPRTVGLNESPSFEEENTHQKFFGGIFHKLRWKIRKDAPRHLSSGGDFSKKTPARRRQGKKVLIIFLLTGLSSLHLVHGADEPTPTIFSPRSGVNKSFCGVKGQFLQKAPLAAGGKDFSLFREAPLPEAEVLCKPAALLKQIDAVLGYFKKYREKDPQAVNAGLFSFLNVTLEDVEETLLFCRDTLKEDLRTGRECRLRDPHFLNAHFRVLRWYPSPRKSRPKERIRITKYVVYTIEGRKKKDKVFCCALYALPEDEQGMSLQEAEKQKSSLSRFKYTKQAVLAGAYDKGGATPLVWVTGRGLEEALMQGTICVKDRRGKKRFFNVNRGNEIPYDGKIRNPKKQKRYWYFSAVSEPKGYGLDIDSMIPIYADAAFAGDVFSLGLGKLMAIKGDRIRLGLLADTGGAFTPNLNRLDYFAGVFDSAAGFWKKAGTIPQFAEVYILIKTDKPSATRGRF